MATEQKDLTSEEALRLLTIAVWKADGNDSECPPERIPTFRQLDDLISTTAWGAEAREDFFRRWIIVETATDKREWPFSYSPADACRNNAGAMSMAGQ